MLPGEESKKEEDKARHSYGSFQDQLQQSEWFCALPQPGRAGNLRLLVATPWLQGIEGGTSDVLPGMATGCCYSHGLVGIVQCAVYTWCPATLEHAPKIFPHLAVLQFHRLPFLKEFNIC